MRAISDVEASSPILLFFLGGGVALHERLVGEQFFSSCSMNTGCKLSTTNADESKNLHMNCYHMQVSFVYEGFRAVDRLSELSFI